MNSPDSIIQLRKIPSSSSVVNSNQQRRASISSKRDGSFPGDSEAASLLISPRFPPDSTSLMMDVESENDWNIDVMPTSVFIF